MPGVTPSPTGHNARNAPGIIGVCNKPVNPEFTHSMLAACMNLAGRARCIEIAAGAENADSDSQVDDLQ